MRPFSESDGDYYVAAGAEDCQRLKFRTLNRLPGDFHCPALVKKQYIVVLHLLLESFGHWWRKYSGGKKCFFSP